MTMSRIVRVLAVTAAGVTLATVIPGMAQAGNMAGNMAGDDEVVMTTARPAALPSAAEQAKAQADAKAKADAAAKPLTTQEQIVAWLADAPPVTRNGVGSDAQPAPDTKSGPRQIHGEASVSIGTGGYRSAYVSSYIPVGETGTLGIAVSQTDYGKNGGYGYGYGGYGYDNYGYGGYGYGRGWGQRGGRSQSVALSLDMSGDNRNGSDTPEGCAPGFRDGDRYIEPLWVTRLNGERSCDATAPLRH